MAMRNFWIDAQIDGRTTRLTGGPQRKDGGFRLEVFIRDSGQSVLPLVVVGTAINGQLELQVDLGKDFAPDCDRGQAIQVLKTAR